MREMREWNDCIAGGVKELKFSRAKIPKGRTAQTSYLMLGRP